MNKLDSIFKNWREYSKIDLASHSSTASNEVDFEDLYEKLEDEIKKGKKAKLVLEAAASPVKAVDSSETVSFPVPKYIPSEAWGDPDSDSYRIMEPFILRAAGKSGNIEERLNHLFRIFSEETAITSPGRIISSLILIESMASILNSFTESPAGFVFEGFLAAITFGRQVTEKTPTGLPIEDIIAFDPNGPNGRPASLKLLKGSVYRPSKRGYGSGPGGTVPEVKGTAIGGSYQNLIYFFDRNDSIDYIVTLKTGKNNLEITNLTISKDSLVNFLEESGNGWLLNGGGRENKRQIDKNKNNWEALRPLLYRTISRYRHADAPDPEANQLAQAINEGSGTSQWGITQETWRKLPGFQVLATIDLSTERLEKLNSYWAKKLSADIKSLFSNVKELSENINNYFVDPDRTAAKSKFGPGAITNTENIGSSMTSRVSSEEEGES